jgi:hypothetical protein
LFILGYSCPQYFYWIKAEKAFRHPQSPFISQVQPSVINYKEPDVRQAMALPTDISDRHSYVDARKNWSTVRLPHGSIDEEGDKVLQCPQDPSMVTKMLGLYLPVMDPTSVIFASGDGAGWASIAAVGCGHNVLVTEPNLRHFDALLQNLKKKIGEQKREVNTQEKEKKKAARWMQAQMEKKKAVEEKEEAMIADIQKKFPGIQAPIATEIVKILKSNVEEEFSLSQKVGEAAARMAQGLTVHHVSVAGQVYHLSTDQWAQIQDVINDEQSKLFKF